MPNRRPVQLVTINSPRRQELVHQTNEPSVVRRLQEMNQCVNEDVFQALHRFLCQLSVQPNRTRSWAAASRTLFSSGAHKSCWQKRQPSAPRAHRHSDVAVWRIDTQVNVPDVLQNDIGLNRAQLNLLGYQKAFCSKRILKIRSTSSSESSYSNRIRLTALRFSR
jgi:hypothetical protein